MTHEEYEQQYADWVELVEQRLAALSNMYLGANQVLSAARYSLLGGGKRIRAVLTLAACQLCGADPTAALDYAVAVEMFHCYSLIHDDLPCMDNDDFRRGKPSCHKAYEEYIALLAGDALLTASFEAISDADLPAESRLEAVKLLAKAGGGRGMLAGQESDKCNYCRAFWGTMTAGEALILQDDKKTGALIEAAVEMGCSAAGVGPDADIRKTLVEYARHIGIVFQLVDDILDVTSTTEELGKPVGSDIANEKVTYVSEYGLEGTKQMAEYNTDHALAQLDAFGPEADFLRLLAKKLLERKK